MKVRGDFLGNVLQSGHSFDEKNALLSCHEVTSFPAYSISNAKF